MPDKRVRVRVNGRADGGVLVLVGLDMTDEEVIAAANEHGAAMVFTVHRHFLH